MCLIDISTSLRKTYDADDEKEIAKMGQFQLTKIRFSTSTEKKTIEYFTIFKWMKDGRICTR